MKKPTRPPRMIVVPVSALTTVVGGERPKTADKLYDQMIAVIKG